MFALGFSLFFYLYRYRKVGFTAAVCLALPLLSFHQVYFYNGGIADFRMDLSLYVLMALTGVWFLVTYETDSFWPWLATGLAAFLCVLNRATSPAYFAFAFGPPFLIRLARLQKPDRMRVLRHFLYVTVPIVVVGGLYLWSNWDFLHYYYFVWGPDPTAKLPLLAGRKHFEYAMVNAGRYTAYACLSLGAVIILSRAIECVRGGGWRKLLLSVDAKIAWFGIAPPLMLAIDGAGYNPFVAMPAVFGGLLFLMAPLRGPLPELRTRTAAQFACALIVAASLFNAAMGIQSHRDPPGTNSNMSAMTAGLKLMIQDARDRGLIDAQFDTTHVAWFEAMMLRNVLYYEFHGVDSRGGILVPEGVTFHCDYHPKFSGTAEINWTDELPGKTDEEKVDYLADLANREIDYMFLPDDKTIDFLERDMKHNYINTKVRRIKIRLLETGNWKQIGPPLVADEFETVMLYVNTARDGGAHQAGGNE